MSNIWKEPTSDGSGLSYAGEFVLETLDWMQRGNDVDTTVALNIKQQYEQLTIYEDMFAPFMSGNLVLRDTHDLPQLFNKPGTDVLHIRISTPTILEEHVIDGWFHIYKIDEREEVSDRSIMYMLHFVSIENMYDQSVRISRTFEGDASSIGKTIIEEYMKSDKKLLSDKTNNKIKYTSNFWTPARNMTYIAERSMSDVYSLPSFVFFENRDGFNIQDVISFTDDITTNGVNYEWDSNDYVGDITPGRQAIKNLDLDYKSVSEVNYKQYFDFMKDASSGLIKTRVFAYDIVSRRFTDKTSTIEDSDVPTLNNERFYKAPAREMAGEKYITGFSHHSVYNTAGSNGSAINTAHQRNMIMRSLQQHKIEIVVFGRTDYTVGRTAKFSSNKMRASDTTDSSTDETVDNLISGFYIVSAVRHRFTRSNNMHECKVELIKDSVQKLT